MQPGTKVRLKEDHAIKLAAEDDLVGFSKGKVARAGTSGVYLGDYTELTEQEQHHVALAEEHESVSPLHLDGIGTVQVLIDGEEYVTGKIHTDLLEVV